MPASFADYAVHGGADAPPAWWAEAVALKDEMSLKDLADKLGVSVTTLAAELKRRGVKRRIKVDAEVAEADEAPPPEPTGTTGRAGSKDALIARHQHLLGKVPDSEISRLAGVSVRTVASYRARQSIPGYQGPRRRPQPRGRRESKVSDFDALLGRVPDRVIADVAGMSLGAVRNYRIKKDIAPAGRLRKPQIDAVLSAWRAGANPSSPPPAPSPAAATPAVAPATARPPVGRGPQAWQVRLHGADAPSVVVAASLRQAVEQAIAAAGAEDRVLSIAHLGAVLGNQG